MDIIRPDFIFSYWIFLWFIIYYFSPITYTIKKYINPFFGLLIALIENIISFIYISIKTKNILIISYYLLMMLLMKGLPIYLLYSHNYNYINYKTDISAFIFVFLIYNIYLSINNTNIIEIYKSINKSIFNGENKTPIFYLMTKLSTILNY
jgi:hypothetical protein